MSSKHKSPLRVIPSNAFLTDILRIQQTRQSLSSHLHERDAPLPLHYVAAPHIPHRSGTTRAPSWPVAASRRCRTDCCSSSRCRAPCCGRCRCRVLDAPPALLVTPPNTYPPRNSRSAGCVEWSRKTSRNCRSSADQSPPPPSASPETPAKTQTNPWMKLPAETHGTIGVPQSVAFPEAFQRHVERFHGREIQI